MKIKIKKNIKIIPILGILFLLYVYYKLSGNVNMLFAMNLICFASIFYIAGFSYFTLKSIAILWVLIAISCQYYFGYSYGNLQNLGDIIYFKEINSFILFYNIPFVIGVYCTNILTLEKEKIKKVNFMHLSSNAVLMCCLIALSASFIAFPTLPMKAFTRDRFHALLPGDAWNHIVLVALIFLIPYWKQLRVKVTYFLCVAWFLAHYERVDMVGFLIALVFIICIKKNVKINIKSILKYGTIFFILISILLNIASIRSGRGILSASKLFSKIIVQDTAADLGHVFISAITYWKSYHLLMGNTYMTYIVKAIPLLGDVNSCGSILQSIYNTAGGDFIINEPLINFGPMGVCIFAIIEICIFHILLNSKVKYSYYLYIILLATVLRVNWYGIYYIEKAVLYFIPIFLIAITFVNNSSRVKRYANKKLTIDKNYN